RLLLVLARAVHGGRPRGRRDRALVPPPREGLMDGRITGAQLLELSEAENAAISRGGTLEYIRLTAGEALAGQYPGGAEAALQRIVRAAEAVLRRTRWGQ